MVLRMLSQNGILIDEESEWPPSARRFVTLRASANNVMRKLEVHGSLALAGLRLLGGFHALRVGGAWKNDF